MILRIFDLSSYCHAGNVNKRAFFDGPIVKLQNGYVQRDIPAGGVSLLFNQLHQYYGTCDMLFCADRNPTIKKEMNPNYKCSRTHARDIEIQKEVMERVLEFCEFTVLYEEGYEADDFIYSAVEKFKNSYEHIYVHTGDSDMYFLVSENVSIAKTHSRTKEVNIDNYSYAIKKDTNIPYNINTFMKVINGDNSDDISPLPHDNGIVLLNMFNTNFYRPLLGDKNFVRSTIEAVAPWALPQVDLVYPLDTYVPDEIKEGDKSTIRHLGYLMKNKFFDYPAQPSDRIDQFIEQMAYDGLYID